METCNKPINTVCLRYWLMASETFLLSYLSVCSHIQQAGWSHVKPSTYLTTIYTPPLPMSVPH